MKQPSYVGFDQKSYYWKANIDYKKNPLMYKIGKGQQGVLTCEPYKSEICVHWRFKTPQLAQKSSEIILSMFYSYLEQKDFVGADMAKKFLHMGYTRSRRYANHRDGRKWSKINGEWRVLPQEVDAMTCQKAKSADIFKAAWKEARTNDQYLNMKKQWRKNEKRIS
jgi:hypothetical protein